MQLPLPSSSSVDVPWRGLWHWWSVILPWLGMKWSSTSSVQVAVYVGLLSKGRTLLIKAYYLPQDVGYRLKEKFKVHIDEFLFNPIGKNAEVSIISFFCSPLCMLHWLRVGSCDWNYQGQVWESYWADNIDAANSVQHAASGTEHGEQIHYT